MKYLPGNLRQLSHYRIRVAAMGLLLALLTAAAALSLQPKAGTAESNAPKTVAEAVEVYEGSQRSAFQDALLQDGVVTKAEMETALTRAAECLSASGVTPIRLGDPMLEGELQLGWIVPVGQHPLDVQAVVDDCRGEYLSHVELTFHMSGGEGKAPDVPRP